MAQIHRLAVRTAAALVTAPLAGGAAAEPAWIEPLWLAPFDPPASVASAPRSPPALLRVPLGWMSGDAAAVLVGDQPGLDPAREGLAAALLAEGAAVLDLDPSPADGRSCDGAAPTPTRLLPVLSEALLALRRDAGAGLVVAVGYGVGGQAALLSAKETTTAHLGAAGPRFAAAAALGPGRPAFALGAAPPAEESWLTRAPLLCAVLAAAISADPPRIGNSASTASPREEAGRDCLAALLSNRTAARPTTPSPRQ